MTKTILFFTGIFLMALISCDQLPTEEPEGKTGITPQGSLTKQGDLTYKSDTTRTDANGFFGTLDGNQEIEGNIYRFLYADNMNVKFYPTGEFFSGTLVSEQTLNIGGNDIPFTSIGFHKNGEVLVVVVASEQTLDVEGNNISFKTGQIGFHENGKVRWGVLASEQTLNVGEIDISFAVGQIFFHENGEVHSGKLFQSINIGGVSYPRFSILSFDNQGNIAN